MTKIVIAYHSPAHFEAGDAELDLLASMLSSGKSSRLYKSLVYEKALAQSVSATQESSVLSSIFTVEIMVRPGVSPDAVEKATDALLAEVDHQSAHRRRTQAGQEPHRVRLRRPPAVDRRARSAPHVYWAEKGDPGYVAHRPRSVR